MYGRLLCTRVTGQMFAMEEHAVMQQTEKSYEKWTTETLQ
jgi:hypothetical protein